MSSDIGLLVIDRFDLARGDARLVPKRAPVGGRTHEAVAAAYAGFDGSVWPELDEANLALKNGLAELDELSDVLAYVEAMPYGAHLEVLAVARAPGLAKELLGLGWVCIGIDIGYYESQWSYFSVLLNEVVYGVNPALTTFAADLNENLLCNSEQQADTLLAARDALLNTGADLENAGPAMRPFGIYVRAEHDRPTIR